MANLGSVPGVPRGCGHRTEGGVYLETGVSLFGNGTPVWKFITDPPIPFRAPHTLGVDLVEISGITHVINHVGSKFYPEACDFIQEGLAWGFSTKVPRSLDLSQLTPQSRLIHVHSKGALLNPEAFPRPVDARGHRTCCARHREAAFHRAQGDQGRWWEAAEEAQGDHVHEHIQQWARAWETGPEKPATGCNFWQWAWALPTLCTVTDKATGGEVERFDRVELRRIWEYDPQAQHSPSIFRDLFRNPNFSVAFSREGNEHGTNTYRVYPYFYRDPACTEAEFTSAMIAALPITQISVIKARDGSHQDTLQAKRHEVQGIHIREADA